MKVQMRGFVEIERFKTQTNLMKKKFVEIDALFEPLPDRLEVKKLLSNIHDKMIGKMAHFQHKKDSVSDKEIFIRRLE